MKRILIICAGLQMGGAERIAANICLFAPKGEFEFHYLIFEGLGSHYASEIEEKGGVVHSIASPSSGYREYARTLGLLIGNLEIDVVHSHTMFNSGINLKVAQKHGVPIRIAHSHTTRTETRVSAAQKLYEKFMQIEVKRSATDFVACGVQAGEWLFGKDLFSQKGIVIRNGIDTGAYAWNQQKRESIRASLGIPQGSKVIGHAGTLSKLKNQEFLIRLLPAVLRRNPNTYLVLLGKDPGGIAEDLVSISEQCGVRNRTILRGGVSNPGDYLNAFDVFSFPSLREGTPLALIEAQCNGLSCVVSDCVPNDAFYSDLLEVRNLDNEDSWVETICAAKRPGNPGAYAQIARDAGFDAASALEPLYDIYRR